MSASERWCLSFGFIFIDSWANLGVDLLLSTVGVVGVIFSYETKTFDTNV